jgi:hypothetical protein
MGRRVNINSVDMDGAELRRFERCRFHVRGDNKTDGDLINEAEKFAGSTTMFIPAEKWEKIFGNRKTEKD